MIDTAPKPTPRPKSKVQRPLAASARPLPTGGPRKLLGSDLIALVAAYTICIVGLWVRHGGIGQLANGSRHFWTSLSGLTGLLASGAGLAGLVLVARPRSIERRYGLDRMFVWHRLLGEAMAILVGVHVVVSLLAATGSVGGVWGAVRDYTGREPYMAGATVGALLVGIVTITSLRSIRRRLAYETWYFIHLLAYIGLAISFSHEIVLGGELADDRVARAFWVVLHVGIGLYVVWGRWGKLAGAARRPLRVARTAKVSADTYELTLAGDGLRSFRGDAGQFMMLRPLTPSLWWQAHPFSLSGAPTTAGLRFTVKQRGDASHAFTTLAPGTRVVAEGPYGACSTEVLADQKLLFIAGGVGIAPVRALLERLDASSAPIVLYRAHRNADLVHLDDIQSLAAARGGVVHTLVGPTAKLAVKDPFSAKVLSTLVPDLAQRTAVLCGPERLLYAARAGLRAAGLPSSRIHFERIWW